jgi:hypothetical protein
MDSSGLTLPKMAVKAMTWERKVLRNFGLDLANDSQSNISM